MISPTLIGRLKIFYVGICFLGIGTVMSFVIYSIMMLYQPPFYRNAPIREQDQSLLVYPDQLDLPDDVREMFGMFGKNPGQLEDIQYDVRQQFDDYDLVEDNLGFTYRNYHCPPWNYPKYYHYFHFFRAILALFDAYAKHLNIEYFLSYGGLLGSVRHGNHIPWDLEVDLMVFKEDINKMFTRIPEVVLDTWLLFIHPEYELHASERNRYKVVDPKIKSKFDPSSKFKDPVARWQHVKEYSVFLDIFGYTKDEEGNINLEEGKNGFNFWKSMFYPPKRCLIFGAEMNCPAESESVLYKLYDDWKISPYRCDPETRNWEKTVNENFILKKQDL